MKELVDLAQMVTIQMIQQILVINVILLVYYVMDQEIMIVPHVMFPMDSISKMTDHVSDLAQIPIMLMQTQENVKYATPVVKHVVKDIMIVVILAQKITTYMLMEHVYQPVQMNIMKIQYQ